MAAWIWVAREIALAIRLEQLANYGGGEGVRDLGLFESAMARPQNLAAYGDPGAAALAASYAFGLARNHPFIDGNKRTAAVVSLTFLLLNAYSYDISEAEIVVTFEALAAGQLSEDQLADWFRDRVQGT